MDIVDEFEKHHAVDKHKESLAVTSSTLNNNGDEPKETSNTCHT
jgi:hypothetical protein